MKCLPIDKLPKRKAIGKYGRLDDFFKSFLALDTKYAKVSFDDMEYLSTTSCRGSLSSYLSKNSLPITTTVVNGIIYLIRTDKGV